MEYNYDNLHNIMEQSCRSRIRMRSKDQKEFGNQCAMRMGKALEDSGVTLANAGLKRCSDYSKAFKDHKPGHVRSAQDLANVFYRHQQLLGANVKKLIVDGSINDNLKSTYTKDSGVTIKHMCSGCCYSRQ